MASAKAWTGWRIGALAALLLSLAWSVPAQAQTDSDAPADAEASMQRQAGAPSFGECEAAVDDAALRNRVFDGARETMRRAALDVNYRDIVLKSWIAARFDQKFERIVDAKIAILRKDRPYLERLLDGNIPSRAEEMAERTANLVFDSPEFEALSQDLQREIGDRLEPLIANADLAAQDRAAECVQLYLGARYAGAVREAFAGDIGDLTLRTGVDSGDVGVSVAFSLAGVLAAMLTVVFRRLVRRIVRVVVRRLAGAIATRLAAWAAPIVGALVLVYELIAGADGVFPVIREELLSNETKALIQNGVIEELAAASPDELEKRAGEIAGRMFERWRDFKENHRAVLALAEAEPEFMAFLQDQPPERFEALSLAAKALRGPNGDDSAVMAALRSGALGEALSIPSIADDLETWGPRGVSLDDLVAWRRNAGGRYQRALAAGLPGVLTPDELSEDEIAVLLEIGGRQAARRVAEMPPETRALALASPAESLRPLALTLETGQLTNLFETLRPIANDERRLAYLERAAIDPSVAATLAKNGAPRAVADSRSPEVALAVMTEDSWRWSPIALTRHAELVADGEIAPRVLVQRYGWGLAILGGGTLIVGISVLRMLLGLVGLRRRRSRA